MLHIKVDGREFYDEDKNEFIKVKSQTLTMEHSLLSISKWESKWKKSFLSSEDKTNEEYLDYFKCMTINSNTDPLIYSCLSNDDIKKIIEYIDDNHTATVITSYNPMPNKKQNITSEMIYYWMIANNIPSEYEKWHLGRLMTLIRICSIKNNPKGNKMSRNAIYQQNRALNAARRAKYNTKG